MVPDKFNMVDMCGIDMIMMQGEAVPGLYDKLIAAMSNCRYQCLYNWLFDGVLIPPTYVQLEDIDGEVFLNEGVSVTSDDVIHIYSVEPGPVEPEIIPLLVEENGVYNVPTGKDGFNPVTVDVPSYTPIIDPITITANGVYRPPAGVDGYGPITVNVEPPPPYRTILGVESQGNQSISTGIIIDSTYEFEIEFSFTQNYNNNNIFGAGYSNAESNIVSVANNIYVQFTTNLSIPFDTNRHIAKKKNGILYLDSLSVSNSYSGPNQECRLFATSYNGSFTSDRISYGIIYSCKIWSSGELVRNFVPVYFPYFQEACFLDTVSGLFFRNNGNGSLLPVEEV